MIVRPEIAGHITEILFDEGQGVRSGAALFRLDSAVARAQVDQAKASLELSRANHERAAGPDAQGRGIAAQPRRGARPSCAPTRPRFRWQATLDKTTLVAPFDGVLGLRRMSVGDYVNPGQDIVNIENIESLKVDFRIPEIYALQLKGARPSA